MCNKRKGDNVKVEFNLNISANCLNINHPGHQKGQKTASFKFPKKKCPNKSFSIVKEEDESKEISKLGDECNFHIEERKNPNEESSSSSELGSSNHGYTVKVTNNKTLSKSCINNTDSKLEDEYEFLERLGSGSYGEVIKVRNKLTNDIRACKIQDKSKIRKRDLEFLRNEIQILKVTDHPNIVRVYEFTEDDKNINIIMEY